MLITVFATAAFLTFGTTDNSCREFGLYPDGKSEYVRGGYNNPDYCLYLPDDDESSFPFFMPGPFCPETGYGYWSGQTKKIQDVYIKLKNVGGNSPCSLKFNFADISSRPGATFICCVNGERKTMPVDGNTGCVEFVTTSLHDGINKISLEYLGGEYVVWDSFEFSGKPGIEAIPVGDLPLADISRAQYCLRNLEGELYNPAIVRICARHDCRIRIRTGSLEKEYDVPKGESVLELAVGDGRGASKTDVSVSYGDSVLASCSFRPGRFPEKQTIDCVDQFMGSSGSRWMIGPGPWMPFGMVKIMPDNEDSHWKAGYEYNIDNIAGFSHIHEWTMAGLLTMPANGPLMTEPGSENDPDSGYRSRIDKGSETAKIGEYSVHLSDYDIDARISATIRASFQKYTYNRADSARILVDFHFPMEYWWTVRKVSVDKVSARRIEGSVVSESGNTGYRGRQEYTLHFVMESDRDISAMNGWKDNTLSRSIDEFLSESENCGLWLDFDIKDGESVQIRTGISLVSVGNAGDNLEKEITRRFGWNIEKVIANQRSVWQDLFDRIRIQTPDAIVRTKFYTNLYRALSPRTIWNDVNGQWIDMNGNVAVTEPGHDVYGGDSLWGTQWNLIPFYSILYPEYLSNWVRTFGEFYRLGGWLPVGNPGMKYIRVMVGSPSIPFVSAAWNHGVRDFDASLLAEAVQHQQTSLPVYNASGAQLGNESYPDYLRLGFVPLYNDSWNGDSEHYQSYVSNTMEYAFQDFCASSYLKSQGRDSLAAQLAARSGNWKNIFDASSGFVRPRHEDGSFIKHFNPYSAPGFCEGSSWQYSWYVPHDVEGLVSAMGKDRFTSTLNAGMEESSKVNFNALGDNFTKYPVNQGNQTNMQAAYLFNFAGRPDLTQKWVRAIQEKYYGYGCRDAYPGDEDQGQMSSWYVLSCLGLFEMTAGAESDPVISLGSPRVEGARIELSDRYYGGNTLLIKAPGASSLKCIFPSVSFNSKKLASPFIRWSEISGGGELEFEM